MDPLVRWRPSTHREGAPDRIGSNDNTVAVKIVDVLDEEWFGAVESLKH